MAGGGSGPCSSLSLCLFATATMLIGSVLAPGLSRQLLGQRVGGTSLLRQAAGAAAVGRPAPTVGGGLDAEDGSDAAAGVDVAAGSDGPGDSEAAEASAPQETIPAATEVDGGSDSVVSGRALSLTESEGFIVEREAVWKLLRWRQTDRMRAQNAMLQHCPAILERKELPCVSHCKAARESPEKCLGEVFWQIYYEPSVSCLLEKRIGAIGEGGKWVCDPHKLQDKVKAEEGCLVYSVRSHGQYDFEAAVNHQVSSSCEIHTIGTTGFEKQPLPDFVHYHDFTADKLSIPRIVSQLGHTKRVIDILNIDCEGCEWETFKAWFGEGVYIRQVLARLYYTSGRKTAVIHEFFKFMFDLGYVVFHKEPDTLRCRGSCTEYGFLKMSPKFSRAPYTEAPRSPLPLSNGESLSLQQSEGFMDQVDTIWELQGQRQLYRTNLQSELMRDCPKTLLNKEQSCVPSCEAAKRTPEKCMGHVFWQVHYEPSFSCLHEGRIGMEGEGGKWVCDPHKLKDQVQAGKQCLVYSIGSHGQYDFETAVHEHISSSCEIHTVDMKNWDKYKGGAPPKFVNYHVFTVGAHPPSKNIPTIVSELGHSKRVIDIFKIDCEGCEWQTFKAWFGEGVYIRQILVELHWPERGGGLKTATIHEFFNFLFSLGYVVFHKEPNTLGCKGSCIEYAFVKMSPEFGRASL